MSKKILSIAVFNNLSNNDFLYYPTPYDINIHNKCLAIFNNTALKNQVKCYEDGNLKFVCSKKEKYMYIIISTIDFPTRVVYDLASKISDLIENPNAIYGKSAIEKILKTNYDYGMNLQNDKITALQKDINEATDIMIENMDKVIMRGENLDALNAKSKTLAEQANDFKHKSTELKKSLCIRNLKIAIAVVFCLFLFIGLLVLIAKK